VTAREGPLLGVGFDLRVAHRPGGSLRNPIQASTGETKMDMASSTESGKVCSWIFTGEGVGNDGGGEGLFLSPEHW